ncbi:condensation domain-containing protein [Dactylosporangium salmoneum]|uniref:Condensation domain-containing protein n=1 Tax=Dactylosporangium salmoneum TaxID=53361 RepID=A0ABN3FY03_9ACTN
MSHAVTSGALPVTGNQERFLLRDEAHRRAGKPPYIRTVSWCARIDGDLDPDRLRAAVGALLARHEALRTRYGLEDGRGYAVVETVAEPSLELVDLTGLPADERLDAALQAATEAADTPFDRRTLPRLRATLYVLRPGSHVLLLVADHIVGDGRTTEILARDVAALYSGTALPEVPLRYVDWVAAAQGPEGLARRERLLEYWRDEVGENRFFPRVRLPFARDEPLPDSFLGAHRTMRVDRPTVAAMAKLARAHRTTMFTVHLATLVAALHRATGELDVTVVVPDDNRGDPRTEDVVGWFATSMALRFRLPPEPSLDQVVDTAREQLLTALEHRGISFGEVLDAGAGRRGTAPPAVVRFEYSAPMGGAPRFDGVPATELSLPIVSAGLGLAIWTRQQGPDQAPTGLEITIVHGLEYYSEEAVGGFLTDWRELTRALLADPGAPVATVNLTA